MRSRKVRSRAIVLVALFLSSSWIGAMAVAPTALAQAPAADPVAILESVLPALRRPYYAQLAGAALDEWPTHYAWQLGPLENPVLDPGFETTLPAWRLAGGARIEGGALVLTDAASTALQSFAGNAGVESSDACSNGCPAISLVHRVRTVSFEASAPGEVRIELFSLASGATLDTTSVTFEAGVQRIPLSAFSTEPGIERAGLAAIRFAYTTELVSVDDVHIDADHATPAGPFEGGGLDAGPSVDVNTPGLCVPLPEGLCVAGMDLADASPAAPQFRAFRPAHDGLAILAMPLADGTILAAVVEYRPSGPRLLTPTAGTLLDIAKTPYGKLFEEAQLSGSAVVLPGTTTGPIRLPITGSLYGVEEVVGEIHLGKLLDPANPANDALDIIPDPFVASLGPALFADLDGDGFPDAVELTAGSAIDDPADVPARNLPFGGAIAASLVTPRIHQIRYPLATLTGFLTPDAPLVAEIALPALPGLTARLDATFADAPPIDLSVRVLASAPSLHWPGDTANVSHVEVALNPSVELSPAAFGTLYDLTFTWTGGSDTQRRAVMLLQALPVDPVVAVLADARVGAPPTVEGADAAVVIADAGAATGASVTEDPLALAIRELNLLRPDVVLVAGDIVAGESGYDAAYDALLELRAPVLLAPGDADTGIPGIDGRAAWRSVFGPLHHATRLGDTTFIAVDTYDWPSADRLATSGATMSASQLNWLRDRLAAAEGDDIIILGHHSPAWPASPADIRSATQQTAEPASFWRTLLRALGAALPHPLDIVFPALAREGGASLDADAPPEGWTGANQAELLSLLAEHRIEAYLAGHIGEDRVARADATRVVAVGAGSTADDVSAFLAASDIPLFLETTSLARSAREYAGYRIWSANASAHALADGHHPQVSTLATATARPSLWSTDLSAAGLYSAPLGKLSVDVVPAASGRVQTLTFVNGLDEAITLATNISFDELGGRLGGRGVALTRESSWLDTRAAIASGPTAAAGSASYTIYLDAVEPSTSIVPIASDTNTRAHTLRIDAASSDDLDPTPTIQVDLCTATDCATVARGLVAGETFNITLGEDAAYALHARGQDAAGNLEAIGVPDLVLRLDTRAPVVVLTAPLAGAWYAAAVTLSATCDEDPCAIEYLVDGAVTSTTIAEEGSYVAQARATDPAGNVGLSTNVPFGIDLTLPRVDVSVVPERTSGWWNVPAALTLTCTDSGPSGCSELAGKIDGAAFTDDAAITRTFETDGTYAYTAIPQDRAGNTGAPVTGAIRIDTLAPSTTILVDGEAGEAGWFRGPVTLTLACDIASGSPCVPQVRIAEGEWADAQDAVVFEAEAAIGLTYRAVDLAGNIGPEMELAFKVDLTPPVTTLSLDGAPSTAWHTQPVTITATCADGAGSCLSTFMRVGGGAWVETTTLTLATSGVHEVATYSVDAAGNVAAPATLTVQLDLVAPTFSVDRLPAAHVKLGPSLAGEATLGPSAGELQAVLGSGELRPATLIDGRWTLDLSDLSEGPHVVTLRITDGAGRAGEEQAVSFFIDAAPPKLAVRPIPTHTAADALALVVDYDDATSPSALALDWGFVSPAGLAGPIQRLTLASPGDITFPLSQGEGSYEIAVNATDAAGNQARTPVARVVVDRTLPSLALVSPTSVLASATPYRLVFDITDASPIVRRELLVTRNDGMSFTTDVGVIDVPLGSNATRALTYRFEVEDAAGNVATTEGEIAILDPTAPLVTLSLSGPAGSAGWFLGPVTARLRSDAADAVTQGRVTSTGSPGPFARWAEQVISAPGSHTLDAKAVARRADVDVSSAVTTRSIRIDLDTPTVSLVAPPAGIAEGERFTLQASAADATSGIASVVATLKRGDIMLQVPFTLEAGVWTATLGPFRAAEVLKIHATATDVAGRRVQTPEIERIVRDGTPPFLALQSPAAGIVRGTLVLSADASDASGVASIVFDIDGAALSTSTWDTRLWTNGPHIVRVRATDTVGNVAADNVTVRVDNAPTAGALVLTPPAGDELTSLTNALSARLDAAAPGGRRVDVTLFHRTAGAVGFTATSMVAPACAADCGALPFSANIAGPFRTGSTLEAYAVARDGDATTRVPAQGVLTLPVVLPVDAPLSTWIDDAQARFDATSSNDIPEDYADILDAAVLPGATHTTFALTLEGQFVLARKARYYVDFVTTQGEPPLFSYNMTHDDAGTWAARIDRDGSSALLASGLAELSVGERELRLRVPTAALAEALAGAPSLQIRFRTIGSGDATGLLGLDIAPPTITRFAPADAARGRAVKLAVDVTDDRPGPLDIRVLATAAGAALAPVTVTGGIADIGIVDAASVRATLIAIDAVGNRVERTIDVVLADEMPPTSRITRLDGAGDIAEGATLRLSGETSTDDVGIIAYEWDLDGDGVTDATGRRISATFATAGTQRIILTVRDAVHAHASEVTVTVLDVTPPALLIEAPLDGAVVPTGSASVTLRAADATRVEVRIDGGSWRAATRGADGAWRVAWSAAEGPHTVDARAYDAAGNLARLARAASITADGTPPSVRPVLHEAYGTTGVGIILALIVAEANGIAAVEWDFGDGATRSCGPVCSEADLAPAHAYEKNGTYTARVAVRDLAGHVSQADIAVTVVKPVPPAPPRALSIGVQGPSQGRVGDELVWHGAVAAGDDLRGLTMYWALGDGAQAQGREIRHSYSAPGVYRIILLAEAGARSGAVHHLVTIAAPALPAPVEEPVPAQEETESPAPIIEEMTQVPSSNGTVPTGPTPAPTPPVTIPRTPQGVTASPARIQFDAPEDATIYWRVIGGDWTTGREADIGGDGLVTVEFYALGPAGREPTRTTTLTLDGFAPDVGAIEWASPSPGALTVRAGVEDTHLSSVTARAVHDATGAVVLATGVRDGGSYTLTFEGLVEGAYTLTVTATDLAGRETSATRAVTIAGRPIERTAEQNAIETSGRGVPGLGILSLLAAAVVVAAWAPRANRRQR